ncbi:hypothetical protein T484DRAFT_1989945, partial [Baffinella frigidus]
MGPRRPQSGSRLHRRTQSPGPALESQGREPRMRSARTRSALMTSSRGTPRRRSDSPRTVLLHCSPSQAQLARHVSSPTFNTFFGQLPARTRDVDPNSGNLHRNDGR